MAERTWGVPSLLLIILGDPWSTAPWAIWKILRELRAPAQTAVCVIGSRACWEWSVAALGSQHTDISWNYGIPSAPDSSGFWFCSIDSDERGVGDPRELSDLQRGRIAVTSLSIAATIGKAVPPRRGVTTSGSLAIVTCPIQKSTCHAAGFAWPGQTEFFSDAWNTRATMVLSGDRLRVALVTQHVALSQVSHELTQDRILERIGNVVRSWPMYFSRPLQTMIVTGLNPHCGDKGAFGDEEARVIEPAIAAAASLYPEVRFVGPVAGDTAPSRMLRGECDLILAMSHDQGLAPLKAIEGERAVNISLGLPHLRVAPDHGPGQDRFLDRNASDEGYRRAVGHALRWLGHPYQERS